MTTQKPTAIQLPDGQSSYQFGYDPVTGLVNSITYPSGAVVTYTWAVNSQSESGYFSDTFGNGSACEFEYGMPAITDRYLTVNLEGPDVPVEESRGAGAADAKIQNDQALVGLIQVAENLRDHQREFYDRVAELRWSEKGPVAFLEDMSAPLYLSRLDPTKNIPNFQMLYLNVLSKRADLSRLRYVDLRWDDEIPVGEPQESAPPTGKEGNK